MIAKGQSTFRYTVDSSVTVLLNIIEDISNPILNKINEIECERKINAEKIIEWDDEHQQEVFTIWFPDMPTEIYYNTLYELYVSIVQRIFSFCENGLLELMQDKSKAGIRRRKKKYNRIQGLSDTEIYYKIIQEQYNVSLIDICSIWTDFNQFHQLRTELTHSTFYPLFQHSQYLRKEYLEKNLFDVKALLLYVEKQLNSNI